MITKSAQAHRGACGCPHGKPKQPAAPAPAAREPIPLPEQPTPIRVHHHGRPPQDCTLHPDGTLTAVLANPAPLDVDGGGGAPADTSVQDALPLEDAR